MPTKITTLTVNELGLASSANAAAEAAATSAGEAAASAAAAAAAENSLLEWKGQWLTATAYAPSDLVYEVGNSYVCLVPHTSGTFATDLTNNYWELFAAKGDTGPGSGDLLSTNNLSDVTSAATSRANLGLGTLATQNGQLGMEFIESQDASASASLDFTGFDAARYDAYMFVLSNVTPTADATFSIRTSTDGGSTYDSGAGAYDLIYHDFSAQGSTEGDTSSNTGLLNLTQSVGAAAGEDGMSGTLMLYGPHLAKRTRWTFEGVYQEAAAGGVAKAVSHGYRDSAADVDAIQFAATSTTLASGTITMYGLRNA